MAHPYHRTYGIYHGLLGYSTRDGMTVNLHVQCTFYASEAGWCIKIFPFNYHEGPRDFWLSLLAALKKNLLHAHQLHGLFAHACQRACAKNR